MKKKNNTTDSSTDSLRTGLLYGADGDNGGGENIVTDEEPGDNTGDDSGGGGGDTIVDVDIDLSGVERILGLLKDSDDEIKDELKYIKKKLNKLNGIIKAYMWFEMSYKYKEFPKFFTKHHDTLIKQTKQILNSMVDTMTEDDD